MHSNNIRWVFDRLCLTPLWESRQLLANLILRQIKSEHVNAAGGILWLIARPLLFIGCYYFLFGVVFAGRIAGGAEGTSNYVLYLLSGIMPWMVFVEAAAPGALLLVDNRDLLKKSRLPVQLLQARAVLVPAIIYLPLIFLLTIAIRLDSGTGFHALFYLLPWFFMQLLLVFYLVSLVSILSAALRDIGHAFQVVAGLLIFVSPVLYPLAVVPDSMRIYLWLNPVTPMVLGYHQIILQGALPGPECIATLGAWIVFLAAAVSVVYPRAREQLMDWL